MCLRCTYLMIPKLCENGQDCVKLKAPGSFERPGTTSTTQCYIPKYLEPLRQPQPLRNVTSRNIWNHGVNYNHYTELHSEMFETTASTTTTTQCYIPKYLKPRRQPQPLHSVTSRDIWNHSVNHNNYTSRNIWNHCVNHNHYRVLHPEIFETTASTTTTTQCYIPKYLKPLRQPQPLRNVTSRNIWNHGVKYNHYTELHPEIFETTASTTTTTQCYIPKYLKPQRQPQPLRNVTSRNIWNHGVNYNHYTELHPEIFETTASTTTTTQCYIPKYLKPQRQPQPLHNVTSRNIWKPPLTSNDLPQNYRFFVNKFTNHVTRAMFRLFVVGLSA